MSQTYQTTDQITTGSNYGRVLDFDSGSDEILCPPESVYTFVVEEVTDPFEKPGFNDGDIDIQVNYTVRLQGYKYDPEDEDDYDWNGLKSTVFMVVGRIYKGKDTPSAVWKSTHAKAKSTPFFKATIPELPWADEAAMKTEPLDIAKPIGRKFRALVTPNKKGYPSLSNFMPVASKPARPARTVAPPPPPVVEDDELDELEDDALYEE